MYSLSAVPQIMLLIGASLIDPLGIIAHRA
jgi:hypothetical protein